MHYRILVTFDKTEAEDSEKARRYAYWTLMEDPSFIGGGRFHSGAADWFVIGGRWSGKLSRATWAREVQKQIRELEEKEGIRVWGASYGHGEKQERQAELRKKIETMYAEAMPEHYRDKGLVYTRDTYQELGYEDDAMLVTQELYDTLLAPFAGVDIAYLDQLVAFADLEYDQVSPEFVGQKWLVVVDAHI